MFADNSANAAIYSNGEVLVEESCFSDNKATLPGLIVVSKAESVLILENFDTNQERNSSVGGLDTCFGIFAHDTDYCFQFRTSEKLCDAGLFSYSPSESSSPSGLSYLSPPFFSLEPSDEVLTLTPSSSTQPSISVMPTSTSQRPSEFPFLSLMPTITIETSVPPKNDSFDWGNMSCYDDIINFQNALMKNETAGQTFIICPNSVFNLTDVGVSLLILENNVTIQCGDNGLRENNCVLWGGNDQITIEGDETYLLGLTLIASNRVSVLSKSSGKVYTKDCEWSMHKGLAVVMVYRGDMLSIPELFENQNALQASGQVAEVIVEGCLFMVRINGSISEYVIFTFSPDTYLKCSFQV